MATHTYAANCHCGHVKLTFTLPEPIEESEVISCNCSICTKSGYVLVYPLREDVTFISGEQTMSQYRFGNKDKPHKFCPTCGTSMLIDFGESPHESEKPHLAINTNAIVDIQTLRPSLKLRIFDGHNKLKPPYEVPQ